jgi:hypothetical protein
VSESEPPSLRVTALSAGDEAALRAFYRVAWNSSSPSEEADVDVSTVRCPFTSEPPPLVGVYSGEALIGSKGSWSSSSIATAR